MPHVFAVLDEPELFWIGTTEAEVRIPVDVPIEPSALVKVDLYVSVTSEVLPEALEDAALAAEADERLLSAAAALLALLAEGVAF